MSAQQETRKETVSQNRRSFLRTAVAGTAVGLGTLAAPRVHAAGSEVLKVALVGCGGRGTGAASQILQANPAVKLWAAADVFSDRLETAIKLLQKGVDARYDREAHAGHEPQIEVPPERRFVGWDAYQKAIDSGVDAVILATTPHFRSMQFAFAVQQGVNAFIEKPVATDAPGVRQVLAAAAEAKKKNLKVAAGFHRYHNAMYQETVERVHSGAIGQLMFLRTYFNHAAMWHIPREPQWNEMQYQMRNWQHFSWASGDHTCEQQAHSFQVVWWLLGKPPLKAQGMGGRQVVKGRDYGDVFDHHAIEFTYDDGLRLFAQCRQINACWVNMSECAHGTEGWVELDQKNGCRIEGKSPWNARKSVPNPYQVEQNLFVDAMMNNKPYNEGEMAAYSSMMSVMARMATYSGVEITWDQALNSKVKPGPKTYAWDAEPPLRPAADGTYEHAVPQPGIWREF
jgi:myo-inositol 2-dehydrogenase / D-chiro-inositol 1-dehydrogenase